MLIRGDSFATVILLPSYLSLEKIFSEKVFKLNSSVSSQYFINMNQGAEWELDREKWSKIYPEFNGLTSC